MKIELEKWELKKLIFWFMLLSILGTVFLSYTSWDMYNDKTAEEYYWKSHLNEEVKNQAYVDEISKNATEVTVGSYIETLKEINMKTSSFTMIAKVWFVWDGKKDLDMMNHFHVYNGVLNKLIPQRDEIINGKHYQLCRINITVSKNFWTKRFPLESHQLRFYLEPDYGIRKVKLKADSGKSGVSSGLSYAGYNFVRSADSIKTMEYENSFGTDNKTGDVTSEYMSQVEINRSGLGVYLKCFIALFGTSLWIFITVYICTYHRVDPLGMIPAALFGTVSNIMVGANLLPDALDIGLLEYVNTWGVFTILFGAVIIININRIRTKFKDYEYATLYGRIMFYTLLFFVVMGHLILPIAAFM
ncbi:MAG: hypothetical protein PHD70_11335 [Anaerostipes sp.]|nr:hypothetical protein [Anaerostipes sp.]